MFANPLTAMLTGFVRDIGIEVRDANLPEPTFLPGLDIRFGALLVERSGSSIPAMSCTRRATSQWPRPRSAAARH